MGIPMGKASASNIYREAKAFNVHRAPHLLIYTEKLAGHPLFSDMEVIDIPMGIPNLPTNSPMDIPMAISLISVGIPMAKPLGIPMAISMGILCIYKRHWLSENESIGHPVF